MSRMRIYVSNNTEVKTPALAYCSQVYSGAYGKGPRDGLRDDVGENISERNSLYAEIGVLYWVWKNTEEPICGLCHHRRFFSPVDFAAPWRVVSLKEAQALLDVDPTGESFCQPLKENDIILPYLYNNHEPLAEHYIKYHRRSDWDLMINSAQKLYPEEARQLKAFFDSHKVVHWWNMFITRREILDEYCSWLFPLLFDIEAKIILPPAGPDGRVLGFLAERLFNWWTVSRDLRILRRPILSIEL